MILNQIFLFNSGLQRNIKIKASFSIAIGNLIKPLEKIKHIFLNKYYFHILKLNLITQFYLSQIIVKKLILVFIVWLIKRIKKNNLAALCWQWCS